MSTSSPVYRRLAAMATACLFISLTACGAEPSDSSVSSAAADPTRVYAEGVPTLDELYTSNEASPPASGPALASDKSIYILSCGQVSPGCAGPSNAVREIAERVGWKVTLVDGNFNVGDGYSTALRQAIAAKADAIVVAAGIGCAEMPQALREAKAADIPVFNGSGIDCDEPTNPGGPSEPLYISVPYNEQFKTPGEFFKEWGRRQAQYIVNATEGKAKIIRTHIQSVQGDLGRAGQDEVLSKCSGCEVVETVEWVAPDGVADGPLVQKFRTALTRHPEANAVILEYDSVATQSGLSKAITDAERQNSLAVVAGEGYASSLELIRANAGLNADFGQSAEWIGWGIVDTMNRFFNDELPVVQGIGFRLIDKDHNMMPPGENYASPFDLAAVYLKSWGVE